MALPFTRDQLNIHADHSHPGHTVIEVTGEVDLATKRQFDTGLTTAVSTPATPHVVLLDLSGVSFLSSSGLQVLTEFQDRADTLGWEVRVVCAGRPVRRPVEIVGLDRRMRFYTSREAALGSLAIN